MTMGGFTLVGLGIAESSIGILVTVGSTLLVSDAASRTLHFENFATAVQAVVGGQFLAITGVQVLSCNIGLSAMQNGFIMAATSNFTNVPGLGIQAFVAGTVNADFSTMSNVNTCLAASVGSKILVSGAILTNFLFAAQAAQSSIVFITNSFLNTTIAGSTDFDSLSGSTIDTSTTQAGGSTVPCYCAGGSQVVAFTTGVTCCSS